LGDVSGQAAIDALFAHPLSGGRRV
jgi:hypothetical protein